MYIGCNREPVYYVLLEAYFAIIFTLCKLLYRLHAENIYYSLTLVKLKRPIKTL